MRDKGISRGLVQTFDTSDRRTRGAIYGFRKMFVEYLNKLGVPFFDPCCPEASTAWQGTTTGGPDTIAAGAGGPIPVTSYQTTVSTDAGGDAFTLADGRMAGQQKKIILGTDGGGNAVITPANLAGGTTVTLNDAADYVILTWSGSEWVLTTNSGAVMA